MTDTHASVRPATRSGLARRLSAAALAFGAGVAQAVTVTVSIGGLPAGLEPFIAVQRNTCGDGEFFVDNPEQPLRASPLTTFEQVPQLGGGFALRPVVVTRYVATFDTPATPVGARGTPERRCSLEGIADRFRFTLHVPGFDAADRATTLSTQVAETAQTGPLTVSTTLSAATTTMGPTFATVSRGVLNRVDATHKSDLGDVRSPRVDLLRPSTLLPGLFTRVASLFQRADGILCVQSGSVTRCQGQGAALEAGGVILRGFTNRIYGRPGLVRFEYELTQAFPVGPLKLRASAESVDLESYVVGDSPQPLDLLPWQPREVSVTVQ